MNQEPFLEHFLDLGAALDLVATFAIVAGVLFAVIQLRQAVRIRRDQAAVDVVHTLQTQKMRHAIATVLSLPDDVEPATIHNNPELLAAALTIDSACEMWGSMVYEKVVDLHMLDRMVGGVIRGSWRRLRRWVEAERLANRNPNVGEWWQWLYEMLELDPDPGKAGGAHISYRGKTRRD